MPPHAMSGFPFFASKSTMSTAPHSHESLPRRQHDTCVWRMPLTTLGCSVQSIFERPLIRRSIRWSHNIPVNDRNPLYLPSEMARNQLCSLFVMQQVTYIIVVACNPGEIFTHHNFTANRCPKTFCPCRCHMRVMPASSTSILTNWWVQSCTILSFAFAVVVRVYSCLFVSILFRVYSCLFFKIDTVSIRVYSCLFLGACLFVSKNSVYSCL